MDFDLTEINYNALGLAGLISVAIYYGLFMLDGMEAISPVARVLALVGSFVGGYFLSKALLEKD